MKYWNIEDLSLEDHVLHCLGCFSDWIQWSYWLLDQILKLTWNIEMTLIWLKMTLKSKTGFYVFSDMILGDMPIIYSGRGLQMTGALGGGTFLLLCWKLFLFKTSESYYLRSNLTYFKFIVT